MSLFCLEGVDEQKIASTFLGQFSFQPIIVFIFVFFSLCSSGFGWKMLWQEVGGSIWSIHCQKSTLRYVNTATNTCCGLFRMGLLLPTMQQSTSKGRR
jgi:hypothetical protein